MSNLKKSLEEFFATGDLGEFLDRFSTLVAYTCQKYPRSYSPLGMWNREAFDDVSQEVLLRLWREDKLREYYDLDIDNHNLVGIVETTIRNFLIDQYRRRCPESWRVRKIVKELLFKDDAFAEVRSQAGKMLGWGLHSWGRTKKARIDVHTALKRIGDVESIRNIGGSRGLSIVVKKLMVEIFEAVAGPVTFAAVLELVESKANIKEVKVVSLEESIIDHGINPIRIEDTLSDHDSEFLEVEIREQAEIVVKKLTFTQKRIWVSLHEGKTLDVIAKMMSCARGTVAYQRDKIQEILRHSLSVPQERLREFEEIFYVRIKDTLRSD